MVFRTWDLNFEAWENLGYGFQDLGSQLWGLDFHTRGFQDRNLKTFRTWFSGCGISILRPGFHTGGFTVAFGHGHPLVSIIIIVHWLLCWYIFHTQCQLLVYISSWIQYDVHHSWMKKSLYLVDKIINDQIWYNVSIQYNMLYSSINMHANIIQNCSNVICNGGTLKANPMI